MLFLLMMKTDVGWGQGKDKNISSLNPKKVMKEDFMGTKVNKFMDEIPPKLYSYTNKIESDGSFEINPEISCTAYQILADLGNSDDISFKLARQKRSFTDKNVTYEYYQQYYKGIKLEGGGYLVKIENGRISRFSPNLYSSPEDNFVTIPSIFENQILKSLNVDKIYDKELYLTSRFGVNQSLVYKVKFGENGSLWAIIDAKDGTVLEKNNLFIPLTGTTYRYGTINFNNYFNANENKSYLSSVDNRIKVYQNYNKVSNIWSSALIPTTSSQSTWDGTSNAWKLSKQALYVTERVDQIYNAFLGIGFQEIRVGTVLSAEATAINSSSSDILIGTLNFNPDGPNYAIYDVVAHELGHIVINEFISYIPGNPNAALHEGLADVFGDYIENFILPGGTDWIMANEEPSIESTIQRNHSVQYCYNSSDSDHNKGKAISHWFYAITNGIAGTDIHSIGGIEAAKNLTLEALNRIADPYAGIYHFRYLTLQVAHELYGINSLNYQSVFKAWERVCVTQQCPSNPLDIIITNSNVNYDVLQHNGGNIIIGNGGVLNIEFDHVYMKAGKKIQVNQGGRLNVFNSSISTCDGLGAWQGIKFENGCIVDILGIHVYNAIFGFEINGSPNFINFDNINIFGNQQSEAGIILGPSASYTFNNINNISGCNVGIKRPNGGGTLRLTDVNIRNCDSGIDINGGHVILDFVNCEDCNISYTFNSSSVTLNHNNIGGDFEYGISSKNSNLYIFNSEFGSISKRGETGIYSADYFVYFSNSKIYSHHFGIRSLNGLIVSESSTIDSQDGGYGSPIYLLGTEGAELYNNTINSGNNGPAVVYYLSDLCNIFNNDINKIRGSSSLPAILSYGTHAGNISQNFINSIIGDGINLNNSSGYEIKCNQVGSQNSCVEVNDNSDLHTIIANYMDGTKDLQTRSVLGEQTHHGNEFLGGTAEAVGLTFDEILLSRFFVDPSFPNHLPSNPIPGNGQWFVSESNPKPQNCNGLIIGPNANGGICEYWKQLKKIKNTKPNKFFINLYHLLHREKVDSSFKLPDCIKKDSLLLQLCGAKKISDIFSALLKPITGKNTYSALNQYNQDYNATNDEAKKEELRTLMAIESEIIKNKLNFASVQDSARIDSLRGELNLIHCDSIIIQKWKEILLLYTKFKQNDSVDIADRSTVLSYAIHCADNWGDAIYLARIMAFSFTNQSFDQYDNCQTLPPAAPKISATKDIVENIKVGPNPTNGQLHIDFPTNFNGQLRISDIAGKLVIAKDLSNINEMQLDLSHLNGLYLIRITSETDATKTFKIIINK